MSGERSLVGAVVVITGASSGIGRATAVAFAAAGARVVLAARRIAALAEVAAECRAVGGDVLVVPTDVTIPGDVQRLLDETLAQWSRIDVLVNNAGTTLFAPLDDDFPAHRRVIETNLIAPMYVAHLLLPIFRRQGRGTLINIGSVLSQVGQPFVPSYVTSKFGLMGLSEAVRAEFADTPDIQVCTVLPYAVVSPHFEEGGNLTGKRAYAMPPAQEPEAVATAIVDVARRPRRLRYVPRYIAAAVALHWMMPATTELLLNHALRRFHLVGSAPPTHGGLFRASPNPTAVRGTRAPVASLPEVLLWVAKDVGRMIGRGLSRRRQRWPFAPTTR